MRYVLLMCGTPDGEAASRADLDATERWFADAERRGMTGSGSHLGDTATTVRIRNGQALITDGPFAESHELIVGFEVVTCDSLDAAVALAAAHPAARLGRVDVRPLVVD